jgi:hypothetical protein
MAGRRLLDEAEPMGVEERRLLDTVEPMRMEELRLRNEAGPIQMEGRRLLGEARPAVEGRLFFAFSPLLVFLLTEPVE